MSKFLLISKYLLCIVPLLFVAPITNAQTVDSCMEAKGNNAIDLCSIIIESGNDDPNVYYKLASELYQRGDTDDALDLIDKSLEKYPNDDNLTRLKSYVELDSIETSQLQDSAQKNNSTIELGKLKITCRTKSTQAGMDACKEYLSETNVDEYLIRARVQEIEKILQEETKQKKPKFVATADPTEGLLTDPTLESETEQPANKEASQEEQDPSKPASKPKKDKKAAIASAEKELKELVMRVQTQLRELGFDAGQPDGIPGTRTRSALRKFYANLPTLENEFSESGFISDGTLEDLLNANSDKAKASKLLEESRVAANQGNYARALYRLNVAEKTSPLIRVPQGYRQEITDQILAANGSPLQSSDQAIAAPSDLSTQDPETTPAATEQLASGKVGDVMIEIRQLEERLLNFEKQLERNRRDVNDAASSVDF